ncbi:hypothetical protein GF351_02115 [Candidatus Woesearchaeota archaeon]|nr:hypothetical protein [Candidatus Woesearchaeota archaeon]
MYRKKIYGRSKESKCPFCDSTASAMNNQGILVCQRHIKDELKNLKCMCGEPLDIMQGKWGPYFRCINCGNISYKKGLEANSLL